MALPIQITVGGAGPYDPAAGSTECIIPALDGKEFFISRPGYGILPYSYYEVITGGGFRLLNGATFVSGEVISISITGNEAVTPATTTYSNGYNLTSVLSGLAGRLGWSASSGLTGANIASSSGRRFDDGSFHAAVTADNIKAVVPQPAMPATWDDYFTARQNATIAKALQSVFTQTEFFEQCLLYNRFNDSEKETTVANTGLAVGARITLVNRFDVTVQLNSLQLYFDGAATFNIYLFKQGSNTPVKTKEVTTVANQKITVPLTDWYLSYKESQRYYLVYFQNDLGSVQAIREETEPAKKKMLSAESFQATHNALVFDRAGLSYSYDSYGINFQASSFRDFTQNIMQQPALFDELIGLTNAVQTLEEILYSTRSNGTERILKDQMQTLGLQLDLNGTAPVSDAPKTIGLKQRLAKEAERVRQSFYPTRKATVINVAH